MNAIKLAIAMVFVGAVCHATQIVAISDLDNRLFR